MKFTTYDFFFNDEVPEKFEEYFHNARFEIIHKMYYCQTFESAEIRINRLFLLFKLVIMYIPKKPDLDYEDFEYFYSCKKYEDYERDILEKEINFILGFIHNYSSFRVCDKINMDWVDFVEYI